MGCGIIRRVRARFNQPGHPAGVEHHNPGVIAEGLAKAFLARVLHSGGIQIAREHHIAAGQQGFDAAEATGGERRFQVRHLDVDAANVDAAKKYSVGLHAASLVPHRGTVARSFGSVVVLAQGFGEDAAGVADHFGVQPARLPGKTLDRA